MGAGPDATPSPEPRRVAVVGCGLIGSSWAALFASAGGHSVRAWDPAAGARSEFDAAVSKIRAQLAALLPERGGTVRMCETLDDALDSAFLVQENAPEQAPLKLDLYRAIEATAPQAIVASSTSALLWSDLARGFADPTRFIIAHPFNPPHLMPLVELFGRDPAILDAAETFYRGLGRVPVRMQREAVGHIANRLASALWREAVNIVAEGIADVEAVDQALVHGPGLRWSAVGAHMAYHLGGGAGGIAHYLQHLGPSQERRWATLGNPKLTPEVRDLLIAGINREAGGKSIAELEQERDRRLIATLKAQKNP